MEGAAVVWCCTRHGTGSRHLVPRSAAGVRRPARSRDGARKGAVSAIQGAGGSPGAVAEPGSV